MAKKTKTKPKKMDVDKKKAATAKAMKKGSKNYHVNIGVLNPRNGKSDYVDVNPREFGVDDAVRQMVEVNAYSNKLTGLGPYKGVVLKVFEIPKKSTGEGWGALAASLMKEKGKKEKSPKLVRIRAMIPELHELIPDPLLKEIEELKKTQGKSTKGLKMGIVDMYPIFIAESDAIPMPNVGEVVWLDFENRDSMTGGIYKGPVFDAAVTANSGDSSGKGPRVFRNVNIKHRKYEGGRKYPMEVDNKLIKYYPAKHVAMGTVALLVGHSRDNKNVEAMYNGVKKTEYGIWAVQAHKIKNSINGLFNVYIFRRNYKNQWSQMLNSINAKRDKIDIILSLHLNGWKTPNVSGMEYLISDRYGSEDVDTPKKIRSKMLALRLAKELFEAFNETGTPCKSWACRRKISKKSIRIRRGGRGIIHLKKGQRAEFMLHNWEIGTCVILEPLVLTNPDDKAIFFRNFEKVGPAIGRALGGFIRDLADHPKVNKL